MALHFGHIKVTFHLNLTHYRPIRSHESHTKKEFFDDFIGIFLHSVHFIKKNSLFIEIHHTIISKNQLKRFHMTFLKKVQRKDEFLRSS